MAKLTLTAQVSTRKSTGKVKVVSDIVIRLSDGRAIAFRTLGGDYKGKGTLALKEFKRDPNKWEAQPGTTAEELPLYAAAV